MWIIKKHLKKEKNNKENTEKGIETLTKPFMLSPVKILPYLNKYPLLVILWQISHKVVFVKLSTWEYSKMWSKVIFKIHRKIIFTYCPELHVIRSGIFVTWEVYYILLIK